LRPRVLYTRTHEAEELILGVNGVGENLVGSVMIAAAGFEGRTCDKEDCPM
jgi:hypothetical protein